MFHITVFDVLNSCGLINWLFFGTWPSLISFEHVKCS